jgi:hypothetical protein
MDVREPQKRRRGFFLHSETGEPDSGEHETAEGIATRTRISRSDTPRQFASVRRNRAEAVISGIDVGRPQLRSGSATGSRQRRHLPR